MTDARRELLVELGCEELPPKALESLARAFAGELRARLAAAGLVEDAQARVFFSPRRLAVLIPGVRTVQPDNEQALFGPPLAAAFDAQGRPTKAAEGFARKCETTVEHLQQKDGKLFFVKKTKGRPAAVLIPAAIEAALAALPIPKRMRWGAGDAEFVRPLHWVVLLFGTEVIDATILGVKTGRETRGHRHMHPAPVTLAHPADYVTALRNAWVWLDGDGQDLRDEIVRQVRALAREAGGTPLNLERDGALVAEIAALVEWPVAMRGAFDPHFLALPEEVLIVTLEHHQRYFPLRDTQTGRLLPAFVFIANVVSSRPEEIRRGNERVIVPRLADAVFFWEADRRQRLEDRLPGLDRVVFQQELGSYGDKSRRVAALADMIAGLIGADPALARQAARLAKCDLLTQLVGEFPELQGTIGKYLARHDGAPEEVARAIEEQYWPRFAGDRLPETRTGQALALADRLDTVCGLFAAGRQPTGDKDPFALRRQALGALRIAIECQLDLDFAALVEAAFRQIKPQPLEGELIATFAFFGERLRAYYEERGIRPDVFHAVEERGWRRPLDLDSRLRALQAFLALPDARNLAAAHKRISNILRQAGSEAERAGAPDPELCKEPAERELQAALVRLEREVRPLLERRDYTAALKALAALRAPVDAFFDRVMVMADDARLRTNRLALLKTLRELFLHTADLSRIQVE